MVNDILTLMLEILIESTLLIAVVLILRGLLGSKLDKRALYYLWIPAMLRLLLPLSIGSRLSVMNLFKDTPKTHIINTVHTNMPSMPKITAGTSVANNSHTISLTAVLFVIWILGVVVVSVFTIWGNMRFSKILRMGRREFKTDIIQGRHTPKIYISRMTQSPCAVGIIRPVIYLPEWAAKSEEDLRYILTHEMTHIKKLDNLYALLTTLCCILFWFDPLVWIMGKFSTKDREPACDAWVISRMTDSEKTAYGFAIVSAVQGRSFSKTITLSSAFASDKNSVVDRIRFIKSKRKNSKVLTVFVIAIMIVSTVAFGTSAKTISGAGDRARVLIESTLLNNSEASIIGSATVFDNDDASQLYDCLMSGDKCTQIIDWEMFETDHDSYTHIFMCGSDSDPLSGHEYIVAERDGKAYVCGSLIQINGQSACRTMSDEGYKEFNKLIKKLNR